MSMNPKLGVDMAGTDLRNSHQGDIAIAEDKANVRAAMLRRLNTPLGGLFSHPDYGNPVHDILSEPLTDAWIGKAIVGIRECLSQESRCSVETVSAAVDIENRKVVFTVGYMILDEPGLDNLVWEVELS